MMDVSKLIQGDNITVDVIGNSKNAIGVILSNGSMVPTRFGKEKLRMLVEIDNVQKLWYPNSNSLKNIAAAYGTNSDTWVGKQVKFTVESFNGRFMVIARPHLHAEEVVVGDYL
jgi:hypothetical protein